MTRHVTIISPIRRYSLRYTVTVQKSLISIPPNKNPPPAKCFSEKSTNCEVPFLKIHQQLSIQTAVGGFLDQALCNWWIFRISTLQLVDFHLEGSICTAPLMSALSSINRPVRVDVFLAFQFKNYSKLRFP